MRYRQLGNTGIEVSEIGLGAWQIGGPLRAYFDQLGWIAHGWGTGFFTGAIGADTQFAGDDRRSWQLADSKQAHAAVAQAFDFLQIPGRSLVQSLLKYQLSFAAVSTVIPGSKNLEHMRENAAASQAPDLTADELRQIAVIREQL